jgi:hypothetical protein
MIDSVAAIMSTIVAMWLGSVEWRLRGAHQNLGAKADKAEVRELVDLKLEAVRQEYHEVKEDIRKLEVKLDLIHKLLMEHR